MTDLVQTLDLDLPPEQTGRRAERVEWGLRQTEDGHHAPRGRVEPRDSEAQARWCLTDEASAYGWRGYELVSRTVVTYTTPWESR